MSPKAPVLYYDEIPTPEFFPSKNSKENLEFPFPTVCTALEEVSISWHSGCKEWTAVMSKGFLTALQRVHKALCIF
jgi:hypothetical protein